MNISRLRVSEFNNLSSVAMRTLIPLLMLVGQFLLGHSLPTVDPGLFVIMGVNTCRSGTGYCLLGHDCTLDEDFLPDDQGGNCDGLRSAFTPSAHFICCRYSEEITTVEDIPTTTNSITETTPEYHKNVSEKLEVTSVQSEKEKRKNHTESTTESQRTKIKAESNINNLRYTPLPTRFGIGTTDHIKTYRLSNNENDEPFQIKLNLGINVENKLKDVSKINNSIRKKQKIDDKINRRDDSTFELRNERTTKFHGSDARNPTQRVPCLEGDVQTSQSDTRCLSTLPAVTETAVTDEQSTSVFDLANKEETVTKDVDLHTHSSVSVDLSTEITVNNKLAVNTTTARTSDKNAIKTDNRVNDLVKPLQGTDNTNEKSEEVNNTTENPSRPFTIITTAHRTTNAKLNPRDDINYTVQNIYDIINRLNANADNKSTIKTSKFTNKDKINIRDPNFDNYTNKTNIEKFDDVTLPPDDDVIMNDVDTTTEQHPSSDDDYTTDSREDVWNHIETTMSTYKMPVSGKKKDQSGSGVSPKIEVIQPSSITQTTTDYVTIQQTTPFSVKNDSNFLSDTKNKIGIISSTRLPPTSLTTEKSSDIENKATTVDHNDNFNTVPDGATTVQTVDEGTEPVTTEKNDNDGETEDILSDKMCIGGRRVTPEDDCWLVQLQDSRNGASLCPGALLSRDLVVTSASCAISVYNVRAKNVNVVVGSGISKIQQVRDVLVHENYRSRQVHMARYDMGLIRLTAAVGREQRACVVCVAEPKMQLQSQRCHTVLLNDSLPGVEVQQNCKTVSVSGSRPGSVMATCSNTAPSTEKVNPGSPLVCDGALAGIASSSDRGQAFTPISQFIDWLKSNELKKIGS